MIKKRVHGKTKYVLPFTYLITSLYVCNCVCVCVCVCVFNEKKFVCVFVLLSFTSYKTVNTKHTLSSWLTEYKGE
jgi:hypothetical protein